MPSSRNRQPMRELANPIRDLFDAAVRRRNIRVSCGCGHHAVLDAHALWWLFERNGWKIALPEVARRCICSRCVGAARGPRRPPQLEAVHEPATDQSLPMPPEAEWKRQLR